MSDQNETFDLDVLREMFKNEAYDLLGELENVLLALEESPHDKDVINRVFRALHTIKGSGGACGFDTISHFAHEVETVYDALRNDRMVTREIINLTLAARDQIAALFDEFYRKKPAESEVTEQIISRFRSLLPEGLALRPAAPMAARPRLRPSSGRPRTAYGSGQRGTSSSPATIRTISWTSCGPSAPVACGMCPFSSPAQAQRFMSAHAVVYSLFNLQRHLASAAFYRFRRARAFKHWNEAAVA